MAVFVEQAGLELLIIGSVRSEADERCCCCFMSQDTVSKAKRIGMILLVEPGSISACHPCRVYQQSTCSTCRAAVILLAKCPACMVANGNGQSCTLSLGTEVISRNFPCHKSDSNAEASFCLSTRTCSWCTLVSAVRCWTMFAASGSIAESQHHLGSLLTYERKTTVRTQGSCGDAVSGAIGLYYLMRAQ